MQHEKLLFWRPFELPATQKASQAGLDRVGDEISKCVSHVVGSNHGEGMSELLVFGQVSEDQGFIDYLKNRFHLPVTSPSPFESLPAASMPAHIRNAVAPAIATHYAAAVGLAMQSVGGSVHG